MALFAQAGIYVIVDLMAPGYLITAANPIWNKVLYNRYTSVIDMMHNYTNLLGFILGDNIIDGIGQNDSGPYIKAAVRDMKAYIRQKKYRPIPVGYVHGDYPLDGTSSAFSVDATVISTYLNCGDKSDENIDFWGTNSRNWCMDSNYTSSGFADLTSEFSAYSIPVFLAAYGCYIAASRDFSEIVDIYGPLMSPIWSGGIIYQYFSSSDVQTDRNQSKHLTLSWRSSLS